MCLDSNCQTGCQTVSVRRNGNNKLNNREVESKVSYVKIFTMQNIFRDNVMKSMNTKL